MRTWIELSSAAFTHNITALSSLCEPSVAFGIVVKANAYGHGMMQIAHMAEKDPRVSWLYTAGIEEALSLRAGGITKPILAMAYHDAPIVDALAHNITLTVYDFASAERIIDVVQKLNFQSAGVLPLMSVHLKVDTGLARLGAMPQEVIPLIRLLASYPNIRLQGIFTHLADTNNNDPQFIYQQIHLFNSVIEEIGRAGFTIPLVHALASGALLMRESCHNVVRVGTNVYGGWKSSRQEARFLQHDPHFFLQPILRWFSIISDMQRKDDRILVQIPVGYYDGYPKNIEHKAYVEIQDQYAPILSIDEHTMWVDGTGIAKLQLGDTVLLLGGTGQVSATTLGNATGTINNEITVRIHPSILRCIIL
jgi:alanine racemase